MKTLNWIAFIIFGVIAILAVIIAFVSGKFEYLFIAFACGYVSYVSKKDITDPQ